LRLLKTAFSKYLTASAKLPFLKASIPRSLSLLLLPLNKVRSLLLIHSGLKVIGCGDGVGFAGVGVGFGGVIAIQVPFCFS
jgi:hypothetical protein